MIKKIWPVFLIGLMGSIGFSGCQSADVKSVLVNKPPAVVSAAFFPAALQHRGLVVVKVEAKDPEDDAVFYKYDWFINKKKTDYHEHELPAGLLERGDRVSATIIPNDGFNDGKPFNTAVSIVGNTPPEIVSIQLLPQPFRPGETIRAVVEGKDREGDFIQYDYQWKINGVELFSENQDHIKLGDLKKGDKLSVVVKPYDGNQFGRSFESLNLTSSNRPPHFTSNPPLQFENGIYSYPVSVSDPDGDPLKYSIQDPQPGMSFDQETGIFQWAIPDETNGVQHVTLVVRDSEGEGAAQKVRLDLDFLRNRSQ